MNSSDKDLVIQFSAKFEQDIDCGGGYVKLMPDIDPKKFDGDTVYNVMFGPDICGFDKKTHVILNHKGTNHLTKKSITPGSDQMTHLYTLAIHPDQTYEVWIDNESKAKGTFAEDWEMIPPKTIPDPDAKKPEDWVDQAKIPDPEDVKPADWDDVPEFIVDPDASKPEDWDDEMDGDWEAPKIKNPDFNGPWKPKMIDNPEYKGEWKAPEIPNPEFSADTKYADYTSSYIGFDLWQVKSGTIFDNVIITDSLEEAKAFAEETFVKYQKAEKAAKDKLDEDEKKKADDAKAKEEAEKGEEKKEAAPEEVKEASLEEEDHDEL